MRSNLIALSALQFNQLSSHLFANEEDICYLINKNTLGVCNLEKDCNNIGIENIGKPSIRTVKDALLFLLFINKEYDIDYISIREETPWPTIRRYKYFQDNKSKLIYIKLSENLDQLKREVEKYYEICK